MTPSVDTGSERDAGSEGTFMALIPGESIGRMAGYGLCTTLAGKASTGKISVKWLCLLPIWQPCQPHSILVRNLCHESRHPRLSRNQPRARHGACLEADLGERAHNGLACRDVAARWHRPRGRPRRI